MEGVCESQPLLSVLRISSELHIKTVIRTFVFWCSVSGQLRVSPVLSRGKHRAPRVLWEDAPSLHGPVAFLLPQEFWVPLAEAFAPRTAPRVRFRFVGAVPVRVMGRVIAKGRIRKGPPAGAGHADPQAGLLQQRVYVEVDLEIAFYPSLRGVDTLLCALPESRALCVCFFPNHNFLHSRHLVRLNIF